LPAHLDGNLGDEVGLVLRRHFARVAGGINQGGQQGRRI
jgi:hypothetical protein